MQSQSVIVGPRIQTSNGYRACGPQAVRSAGAKAGEVRVRGSFYRVAEGFPGGTAWWRGGFSDVAKLDNDVTIT
jgi:hypothetical protein